MKFLKPSLFTLAAPLMVGALLHCPGKDKGSDIAISPLLFVPQQTNTVGCSGAIPAIGTGNTAGTVAAGKTAWYRFQALVGTPTNFTVTVNYPGPTSDNVDLYVGKNDTPLADTTLASFFSKKGAGLADSTTTDPMSGNWVCIGVKAVSCSGTGTCSFTLSIN